MPVLLAHRVLMILCLRLRGKVDVDLIDFLAAQAQTQNHQQTVSQQHGHSMPGMGGQALPLASASVASPAL